MPTSEWRRDDEEPYGSVPNHVGSLLQVVRWKLSLPYRPEVSSLEPLDEARHNALRRTPEEAAEQASTNGCKEETREEMPRSVHGNVFGQLQGILQSQMLAARRRPPSASGPTHLLCLL